MDIIPDFWGLFQWPFENMPLWGSKDKKIFLPVLINHGNTDPRISVLQVLYRTPEFRQAWERKRGNSSSDWELKHNFDELQRGICPQFKYECKLHDAAEFMEQLLKDLSVEVSQPFCGTLVCSEGHCVSEMSRFCTLLMPLTASVEKGLEQMFDCKNTCESKSAVKDNKKPPPQILVFHLKRFDLKVAHVKSDSEVELTETLLTQGYIYSLWAVVDHRESVREGQYSATISENGIWYEFENDRKKRTEAPTGQKSSTAVLLIYRQNQEASVSFGPDQDQQRWMESNRPNCFTAPYHGLMNQGSTCYLNSVLQVLFMNPEFRKALEWPSNPTDRVLKNLFDKLQKGLCGTESVTKNLQAPNVQRCAAEYLEIILNRVSAEVSKPFHGELLDITLCSRDHCINQETSKFWTLPLSMDLISSVEEGFARFFEPKKLRGIHCNECEKEGRTTTEAISKYEMAKSPQILVLLMKKFDIDHKTGHNYKSHSEIEIPGTLPTEGVVYTLCGVVDHSGRLEWGHYTATIQSREDGHWYRFDDTYVRQVQVPYSRSSTAYLLIYRALAYETMDKVPSGKKSSSRGKAQSTLEKAAPQAPDNEDDKMDWESAKIYREPNEEHTASMHRSNEGHKAPMQKDRSTEEHRLPGHKQRSNVGHLGPGQKDRSSEEQRGSGHQDRSNEKQRGAGNKPWSSEGQKTQGRKDQSSEGQKGPGQTDWPGEVHKPGHREWFSDGQSGSGLRDRSNEEQRGAGNKTWASEGQKTQGHKDQSSEGQKGPGQTDWPGDVRKGPGQTDWPSEVHKRPGQTDWPSEVHKRPGQTDWPSEVHKPGHREWYNDGQSGSGLRERSNEEQRGAGHKDRPNKGQGYNVSPF